MSSSSNAYDLRNVGESEIEFTTEFNVVYRASFGDGSGYFPRYPEFAHLVRSFAFIVITATGDSIPRDLRVGVTISLILQEHFDENPEDVLFFIHENSDGKQHGRKRMFDAWYRKASTDMLLKQDAEINIGRFSILASILLRRDHPHLEAVLSGFEALVMEAGEKPD